MLYKYTLFSNSDGKTTRSIDVMPRQWHLPIKTKNMRLLGFLNIPVCMVFVQPVRHKNTIGIPYIASLMRHDLWIIKNPLNNIGSELYELLVVFHQWIVNINIIVNMPPFSNKNISCCFKSRLLLFTVKKVCTLLYSCKNTLTAKAFHNKISTFYKVQQVYTVQYHHKHSIYFILEKDETGEMPIPRLLKW